jgi:hypothetical protein
MGRSLMELVPAFIRYLDSFFLSLYSKVLRA